jgi:hypothetical protein
MENCTVTQTIMLSLASINVGLAVWCAYNEHSLEVVRDDFDFDLYRAFAFGELAAIGTSLWALLIPGFSEFMSTATAWMFISVHAWLSMFLILRTQRFHKVKQALKKPYKIDFRNSI